MLLKGSLAVDVILVLVATKYAESRPNSYSATKDTSEEFTNNSINFVEFALFDTELDTIVLSDDDSDENCSSGNTDSETSSSDTVSTETSTDATTGSSGTETSDYSSGTTSTSTLSTTSYSDSDTTATNSKETTSSVSGSEFESTSTHSGTTTTTTTTTTVSYNDSSTEGHSGAHENITTTSEGTTTVASISDNSGGISTLHTKGTTKIPSSSGSVSTEDDGATVTVGTSTKTSSPSGTFRITWFNTRTAKGVISNGTTYDSGSTKDGESGTAVISSSKYPSSGDGATASENKSTKTIPPTTYQGGTSVTHTPSSSGSGSTKEVSGVNTTTPKEPSASDGSEVTFPTENKLSTVVTHRPEHNGTVGNSTES